MRKTKAKIEKNRGITLIALAITIIVLLILAGISIQMINGDNGILKKARESKGIIDEASALEYVKLSIAAARTVDNGISKVHLEDELRKYFEQVTVEANGKNDYMIDADGRIYNIDNNGQLTSGYKKETSEDGIMISTCDEKYLDSKIYGNSIQNGQPTPDNPVEIQSVGDLVTEGEYKNKYKIPITVNGKNLLNVNEYFPTFVNSENGITYSNKNFTTIGSVQILNGKFESNTQYTISCEVELSNVDDNGIQIRLMDSDGKVLLSNIFKTTETSETKKIELTNPANKSLGYIDIKYYTETRNCNVKISNIQVEKGDNATEYEPYQEPKTANIYLDEPLRKIGDYADYIDFKNNKVVRNVSVGTLKASSVSSVGSTDNTLIRFYMLVPSRLILNISNNVQVLSNKLEGLSFSDYANSVNNSVNSITGNTSNSAVFLKIKSDLLGITEDMTNDEKKNKCNEYLSNNPVTINYILKNQTEQNITLPEILMHKGTNIITVDTQTKPSKIETTYYTLN